MSTLARISVPRPDVTLRVRLWACYALLALLWIATAAHRIAGHPGASFPWSAAIWTLWLPAADWLSVRIRRVARGREFFGTDYRHLHHYLLAMGWRRTIVFHGLVATCAAIDIMAYAAWSFGIAPELLVVLALAGLGGFHAWMVSRWRRLTGYCIVLTQ